jgi:hypothetical protein
VKHADPAPSGGEGHRRLLARERVRPSGRAAAARLKFFCESRPGLIGWIAIDLSLAAKQHELHGTATTPMLLVVVLQALYVADYFFDEPAILTT